MKIYEKANSFRAELFKNLAYFFASMPGLVIVQTIIFGETIDKYYNSSGLFLFFLLIAAYFCIIKALEIYETIDLKQEEEVIWKKN